MNVAAWLHGLGLGQYEQAFRENDIDAAVLADQGRSISVTGDCERSTSNALEKTSRTRAETMTARNRRSIGVKRWPPASFHVGRG